MLRKLKFVLLRNLSFILHADFNWCMKLSFFFLIQQAEKVIEEHNSSRPLFLYLPFQNVHFPVQAPQSYIDKYSFINNKQRKTYAAMLDVVDEAIANVTMSLQKAG